MVAPRRTTLRAMALGFCYAVSGTDADSAATRRIIRGGVAGPAGLPPFLLAVLPFMDAVLMFMEAILTFMEAMRRLKGRDTAFSKARLLSTSMKPSYIWWR